MAKKTSPQLQVPSSHNWRTTDEDEINRRRARAQAEQFRIFNETPQHPIFSNFKVCSSSGMRYRVEVRDIAKRQFACECVDFSINGLGTCKHVEAVHLHLETRFKRLFQNAARNGSTRLDVVPDLTSGTLKLIGVGTEVPRSLRSWFGIDGSHRSSEPQQTLAELERLQSSTMPELRLSQELGPWLQNSLRTFPTSVKACCTWPSANARCWRMRWVWAKPFKPLRRAHWCTVWSEPHGRS